MDNESLFRMVAIILAAGILATSWDFSWLTHKLGKIGDIRMPSWGKKKEISFIQVVESWHTLKNQCETLKLTEAIHKIDEVFPLLNTEE